MQNLTNDFATSELFDILHHAFQAALSGLRGERAEAAKAKLAASWKPQILWEVKDDVVSISIRLMNRNDTKYVTFRRLTGTLVEPSRENVQ